jgi:hypothetical protein
MESTAPSAPSLSHGDTLAQEAMDRSLMCKGLAGDPVKELLIIAGAPVTLAPGQTFYDGDDVHIVGRAASQTAPAKFLVFLVKDKSARVLTPVT